MAWDDEPPPEKVVNKKVAWDDEPPPSSLLARTKETTSSPLGNYVSNVGGALSKLSNSFKGVTVRPAAGLAMELATQKPAFLDSEGKSTYNPLPEMGKAVDPRNLQQGSSIPEMMERTGIPNPSLADANPRIKRGSWADISLGGTADTLVDPALLTGVGEAALAAKGLPKLAMGAKVLDTVINPLSMASRGIGKGLYESTLLPLEQQGVRKGKEKISEEFYKAGVATPFNLVKKGEDIIKNKMDQRRLIFDQAENSGGQASMKEAVAPMEARIAEIRQSKDPRMQPLADKMQNYVDEYLEIEKATPEIAPQISTVKSNILDEAGLPYEKTVVTPGKAAIPGKIVTPAEASSYKTSIYNTQPRGYNNVVGASDAEADLDALLAKGQLEASQNAVERALGPEAAARVENLNKSSGNILSTQPAQQTVTERAQRQANQLKEISPLDIFTGTAGAAAFGTAGGALGALAAKKAGTALMLSKMPAGYLMRKLGEKRIVDRLNSLAGKRRTDEKK